MSEGPGGKENAELSLLAQRTAAERSRVTKLQHSGGNEVAESRLNDILQSGCQTGDFEPFIDHLKALPPARVDLEIRSLDPRIREGRSELSAFVMALTSRLATRKDFELVNAWTAVFLKIHADTVVNCAEDSAEEYRVLKEALGSWSQQQDQEAKRLAGLVGYSRGVVSFLRSQ